jgi:RNA polymerase sigma-70 factor (ECF subfamily)
MGLAAVDSASTTDGQRLLELVVARDRDALTKLVSLHHVHMVRLCYLITRDVESAQDASQNTWVRLWTNPPRLRDESRLRSWLLSVAANEARQIMRRRRLGQVRELDAAKRPHRNPVHAEASIDLKRVLATLTADERVLLGLRYAVGMTSAEIAEHYRMSPEGIRSRLHRLLRRIRKDLEDE